MEQELARLRAENEMLKAENAAEEIAARALVALDKRGEGGAVNIASILNLPYKRWFIYNQETGGYTAGIEEFPGCLTEGDTLEDAHQMLLEAAESWILASLEMGHEIPIPLMDRTSVPKARGE